MSNNRALITGWFSNKRGGATIGDLLSAEMVAEWLSEWNIPHDIADVTGTFVNAVDWRRVKPNRYAFLIFVCGPLVMRSRFQRGLINRFKRHSKLIGLNLSIIHSKDRDRQPFDVLIERDSAWRVNPDIVFGAPKADRNLVGIILRGKQIEYGIERCKYVEIQEMFNKLIAEYDCASFTFNTEIKNYIDAVDDYKSLEILISRFDAILTTRLHGAVFAIKNGVPVIAVDQILGGAKVSKVLSAIEWPYCFIAGQFTYSDLSRAFKSILSKDCSAEIEYSNNLALKQISLIREELFAVFRK